MLLNCHSYYSINYGCMSIQTLVDLVIKLGHKQVAITDINNTSETFRFLKLAQESGLNASIGIDFRNGIDQQFVGIAKNWKGFYELNEYLSTCTKNKILIPKQAPLFKEVFVVYPYSPNINPNKLLSHEFMGINPSHLNKPLLKNQIEANQHKIVALCTATFRHKKDYNAHRLLRAIELNTLLSKLNVKDQASENDKYLSFEAIKKLYVNLPQVVQNTQQILTQSQITFDFNKPQNNKKHFTSSTQQDIDLLRKQSISGLYNRYNFSPKVPDQPQPTSTSTASSIQPIQADKEQIILNRLENELKLIQQCNFCSYFLINWDLISYAQKKSYPYVGRGSGANSMVAYLLKITNVDPIDLDLYFERFINPHRNNPPDFDVDFSWTDREDITRYLFDTYGWDKVALLGSYQTYQKRAVIREIGKVFGLPEEDLKSLQRNNSPQDQYGSLVKKYSEYIAGFPSHLSIHASGILISEKPIHCFTATHLPPKNFPTTHFDMQIAEDIGLFKFDILSQRGLGKIKDAIRLIKLNRNVDIDIDQIEKIKTDPKVKKLLKKGDLTGCFYVESPAMRMLMTKLKAEDYTRLVAASSIIRPGVAKSGMMREYILRFHDKNRRLKAQKSLPEFYQILEETYGVMVYQEDVIKVAHMFAKLELADADILRRGMSWKFKERVEFSVVENKFFDNCQQLGYNSEIVHAIWEQIQSFANYAFSKGHSASYAVESFQALYLHAYYPLEYLTATLNNGGGFYSRELYVHTIRMKGGHIHLPCINTSDILATIRENTIYLGLGFIKNGFESENRRAILEERNKSGPFVSFRDFVERLPVISLEQLVILIRAGCFNCFERNKKKLLWDAHFLLSENPSTTLERANLFQVEPKVWKLPKLNHYNLENTYDEMEIFGFPISMSPFELIDNTEKTSDLRAAELPQLKGKQVSIMGYRVHIKKNRASNGLMQFGTFIDRDGDWIDTVTFANAYNQNQFAAPGCYLISGLVTAEFGHTSLQVSFAKRLKNKEVYAS